jgi:nucleoside-diphosphate-sugar epimerase
MSDPRPIVILGTGYTGRWIYKLAREQSLPILASSRRPEHHLGDVAQSSRIQFDLDDPTTWSVLPLEADLIWTFPAAPLERVRAFARLSCNPSRRLVVLGSTSAYDRGGEPTTDLPPWIDEASPVNLDLPRVQGEEYLRTQHGGMILRVAGIYGPNRNPVEWIRQGRVGPTNKFVNLVHVEDLARLCLLVLRMGRAGDIYNISDGHPRRWADICAEVSTQWGIVSPREAAPSQPGKRICNRKALEELGYTLRHPDLYHTLAAL